MNPVLAERYIARGRFYLQLFGCAYLAYRSTRYMGMNPTLVLPTIQ